MLARRLTALVEAGLLERRRYSERPPKDEYVLTRRGWISAGILLALLAFGNVISHPTIVTFASSTLRRERPSSRCWWDSETGRRVDGPGYSVVSTLRHANAA